MITRILLSLALVNFLAVVAAMVWGRSIRLADNLFFGCVVWLVCAILAAVWGG